MKKRSPKKPENADREGTVNLTFVCADCGDLVLITDEAEIMNLVETQLVAETRQLHCWECIDG